MRQRDQIQSSFMCCVRCACVYLPMLCVFACIHHVIHALFTHSVCHSLIQILLQRVCSDLVDSLSLYLSISASIMFMYGWRKCVRWHRHRKTK